MTRSSRLGARLAAAIGLGVASVILSLSFIVTPERIEGGLRLTPPCPYRLATGEPCLGCGLTRAFSAISHGRLSDARRLNPRSPWLYAATWLLGVGSLAVIALTFRGRSVSVSPQAPSE